MGKMLRLTDTRGSRAWPASAHALRNRSICSACSLTELARAHRVSLPSALTEEWPPQLSTADERGWFRFQRLYDTARSVLRTPDDLRRLVREIAEDERAEGSRWLELQADPSGFAAIYGGITAFTELLLDAAEKAARAADIGIGIIIAANRTRHPMDARTLARLASQYAGQGVIGFGLSNDERRGPAADFVPAFRIAERAGLMLAPHAGELVGPASVTAALDQLHADRLGHGVRSVEDPRLVERLAAGGVTCEVCPSSNVSLGVEPDEAAVPVRTLVEAGVPVALGADDPLLFGRRLVKQYEIARDVHGFTPAELAELARMSIRGSAAPPDTRARLLSAIDAWLARLGNALALAGPDARQPRTSTAPAASPSSATRREPAATVARAGPLRRRPPAPPRDRPRGHTRLACSARVRAYLRRPRPV